MPYFGRAFLTNRTLETRPCARRWLDGPQGSGRTTQFPQIVSEATALAARLEVPLDPRAFAGTQRVVGVVVMVTSSGCIV